MPPNCLVAPQSQTQDPVGLISTRQKPTIPERACTVSEEEPGASSEGIAPVGIEDVQQIVQVKEDSEEQSAGVEQQDPEHLHIKEEKEELWTSLKGEHLHLKEETDSAWFQFSVVSIKSEDDEEKPLVSQLHQQQIEDKDVPTSSSSDQMAAEICGVSGTSRNPDLNPHEQTSDSSETEVSGDDDMNLDSGMSGSGSETGDEDHDWKEKRSSESDVKTVNISSSCLECGEQFHDKQSLQKHVRVTSHSVIRSSSFLVNKKSVRFKQPVDPNREVQKELKSFSCDCGKIFGRKSSFNRHQRIHTGQKPFACELCGNRFTEKSTLNTHMTVHTGQKPFICELCGNRFNKKSALHSHMRVHTGQKPFICDLCGNGFTRKSNLNTHVIKHTGQNPFICELCGNRFTEKSTLNTHMRVHTGQKPFICELCGNRFTEKSTLHSHMRVHTGQKPFICELCGNGFTRKSNLNSHMRVHTGQKPFICELCGNRFTEKSTLNTHMRVHTGQKPFICDLCGNGFTSKSNLNYHMRVHTGQKPFSVSSVKKDLPKSRDRNLLLMSSVDKLKVTVQITTLVDSHIFWEPPVNLQSESEVLYALYKKGQSHLYLLRRLRSLGAHSQLLKSFYHSVVGSVVHSAVHLLTMGVRATGRQSFNEEMVEDFGTGTIVAILKQAGTTDRGKAPPHILFRHSVSTDVILGALTVRGKGGASRRQRRSHTSNNPGFLIREGFNCSGWDNIFHQPRETFPSPHDQNKPAAQTPIGLTNDAPPSGLELPVSASVCRQVTLLKVADRNKRRLWVYGFLIADRAVQFSECSVSAGLWGNVNSRNSHCCEFPRSCDLSARCTENPGSCSALSGTLSDSQVSMRQITQQSRISRWNEIRARSLHSLFSRDCTLAIEPQRQIFSLCVGACGLHGPITKASQLPEASLRPLVFSVQNTNVLLGVKLTMSLLLPLGQSVTNENESQAQRVQQVANTAKENLLPLQDHPSAGTDSSCVLHHLDLDSMDTGVQQSAGVEQQDPEHLHIKKEKEELWTSLKGEHLHLKEETDSAWFQFSAVSIKSEDDEEKRLFSQLHQQQIEDKDVPTSSSSDQMTAEICGVSGTSRNPDLNPHEQTSDSSETEVSGGDDMNLDSGMSDSGSETGDEDHDWKEKRSSESDVKTVNISSSCLECGERFHDKQSLQKHVRVTSHSVIRSSSFLVNKKSVRLKQPVDSYREVQKELKSFSCDCGKIFGKKSSFNRHQRIHTGQKPFACELCGNRFTRKSNLNTHMIKHTGQKPFVCELCGNRFTEKSSLNAHMRVHTGQKPFICELCGNRFTEKSTLHRHMRVHTGQKPFICDLCGNGFSRESNLNSHMRVHTGQKPFICELCGNRFTEKSTLHSHMRVHKGQKPFICDLCGNGFTRKSNLNSHMRVHTGQKPFICELCEKRFSKKSALNTHMRIHTGQKPFICELCGNRFTEKSTLNSHMRVHTGQKPFICELCEKRFKNKSNLSSHMRVHTGQKPFICELCEKRFKNKSHLNSHMRVHTGQKPFICELCEKRFQNKSNLNCHMRVHTGQKPFICELCEKRFKNKSHLNRHMIVHTGQKPFCLSSVKKDLPNRRI
ncbi:zinc finger protein 721-like [Nothobranchius furzeri]|uniref:zinc finger protein 721-like n=1 Tax=Nothobranchius furzeri TaxID=105023 RepID=UPI003904CFF5